MFDLDARLARDSVPVLPRLRISQVRLMDDARFPWLLLVPEREGVVNLHDLDPADGAELMAEARLCSAVLCRLLDLAKTNVATLGNVVPQLHLHVVGRRAGDAAWPGPVWGAGTPQPYAPAAREALVARIAAALGAP
jgi:diadenosine tetraphosphate (Ap4A) HIT family hydrolase